MRHDCSEFMNHKKGWELNILVSWCGNNLLILSVNKTKGMFAYFKIKRVRSNTICIMGRRSGGVGRSIHTFMFTWTTYLTGRQEKSHLKVGTEQFFWRCFDHSVFAARCCMSSVSLSDDVQEEKNLFFNYCLGKQCQSQGLKKTKQTVIQQQCLQLVSSPAPL